MKIHLFSLTLFLLFVFLSFPCCAQVAKVESLISKSLQYNPEARINELYLQNSEANYQIAVSSLRPSLSFTSDIPGFTRSISSVTQPDGTVRFLPQSQSFSSMGLTMNQRLGFSGGTVSISSGLNRLSVFEPTSVNSWQSSPLLIGYSQPLFQFNSAKYQRQLADLRLLINKQNYKTQRAQLVYTFIQVLFEKNLLSYRIDLNNRRLKYLSEMIVHQSDLVSIGKILQEEIDLLILEKAQITSELARQEVMIKQINERLLQFISVRENTDLDLAATIPPYLDSAIVFQGLIASSPTILQAKLERFNAQLENTRAIQNKGLQANFNVSVGFNQRGQDIESAYQNLLDQERVTFSLNVPILDGKRTKSQAIISANKLKVAEFNYDNSSTRLLRRVYEQWSDYVLTLKLLASDQEMIKIAAGRFERYKQLAAIGKVSNDQLNQAELTYREYQLTHIQHIVDLWNQYYLIQTFIID